MAALIPPRRLTGGLICDGTSPPRRADLRLRDGRIAEILEPGSPIDPGEDAVDVSDSLVTPGLTDVHTHLFCEGDIPRYLTTLVRDDPALRVLKGAKRARDMLKAGFTTVRDVSTEGAGYADVALFEAIQSGFAEGPRIFACGPGVGITGGYLPGRLAPGVCVPAACATVDGEDAIRKEIREQCRRGVAWIKAFVDWGCPHPHHKREIRATFTEAELFALVDEARRRNRKVAAHATSDEGAANAIRCGVASIEHLPEATQKTFDLAAEKGVFVVPTLSVVASSLKATNPLEVEDAKRRMDAQQESFTLLMASGARIASGSDVGAYPHQMGARSEIRWMVELGLSPLDALRAATGSAADLLGLPDIGAIRTGAIGDLCVFPLITKDGRPDLVATIVGDPRMVWQGGAPVR